MNTPINLNKARKARARKEAKARADSNVRAFGVHKADKNAADAERTRAARRLEGKSMRDAPKPET